MRHFDEFGMPYVREDYKFKDCLTYNKDLKAEVRIVLAGETGAGKTSAVINYMEERFFNEYNVTEPPADVYRHEKNVSGIKLNIEI